MMFETPTHGEKFDRRGYYYGGPAARGLDRFPVRLQGDAVYVDLDRIIQGPARKTHPTIGPTGPLCYAY
jgi:Rieske Fe-S protein